VAENGGAHFFRPALLGEDGDADEGMFFARGVLLVVEIVEERGGGPGFKKSVAILAGKTGRIGMAFGAGADAALNRERVFEQAGRLRVLVEQRPGAFAGEGRSGHRFKFLFGFSWQFQDYLRTAHSFHLTRRITSRQCMSKVDIGVAAVANRINPDRLLWRSVQPMATTLATVEAREVLRCDSCGLVQFRTSNSLCRRLPQTPGDRRAGSVVSATGEDEMPRELKKRKASTWRARCGKFVMTVA